MINKKEFLESKYIEAERLNDWTILKPYPYLLFRWQIKNRKDEMAIAKYASCKLGHHVWCTDNHEWTEVNTYVNDVGEPLPF